MSDNSDRPADEPDDERYPYDQPTPADDTVCMSGRQYIDRVGEPPIPVGCGATCAEEIPPELLPSSYAADATDE